MKSTETNLGKTNARVFCFGNDLTDFAVKLITFSIPTNLNPARATNTFRTKCNNFHNIHLALTYLMMEEILGGGGGVGTAIYGLHRYLLGI